jgi:RNA polymerase sigma factor (sigma-70 family)
MNSAFVCPRFDSQDRFRAVVLPHLDDAHRLARCLTGSPTDSQDVVQEATVRLLRFIDTYRGGDSRAWVLKVVRNTTFTWLGANRRTDHVPIDAQEHEEPPISAFLLADEGSDPSVGGGQTYNSKKMRELLGGLSLGHREVVILRYYKGHSYRQISETLGVPIGTVMSRLARAHSALGRRARDGEEFNTRLEPIQ